MFSKLLTPEKEQEYIQKPSLFFSKHATGSNANDISSRVRMMDLDTLRITEADIQQEIEQRQKNLQDVIENKVQQKCKVHFKKVKLAQDRVLFAELQQRYRKDLENILRNEIGQNIQLPTGIRALFHLFGLFFL